MRRSCVFPGCPRKDVEAGQDLCPGHSLLFSRSTLYFSKKCRAEALAEWIGSAAKPVAIHSNGVPKP